MLWVIFESWTTTDTQLFSGRQNEFVCFIDQHIISIGIVSIGIVSIGIVSIGPDMHVARNKNQLITTLLPSSIPRPRKWFEHSRQGQLY